MSEPPKLVQDDTVPPSFANVPPPRELHATSDIRFVITELAKFGERIDRLIKDVEKQGEKLDKQADKLQNIERNIDRVMTGGAVAVAILTVVGGIFWWAIGDRITASVHMALGQAAEQKSKNSN